MKMKSHPISFGLDGFYDYKVNYIFVTGLPDYRTTGLPVLAI